jgi:hypothetical protein
MLAMADTFLPFILRPREPCRVSHKQLCSVLAGKRSSLLNLLIQGLLNNWPN